MIKFNVKNSDKKNISVEVLNDKDEVIGNVERTMIEDGNRKSFSSSVSISSSDVSQSDITKNLNKFLLESDDENVKKFSEFDTKMSEFGERTNTMFPRFAADFYRPFENYIGDFFDRPMMGFGRRRRHPIEEAFKLSDSSDVYKDVDYFSSDSIKNQIDANIKVLEKSKSNNQDRIKYLNEKNEEIDKMLSDLKESFEKFKKNNEEKKD